MNNRLFIAFFLLLIWCGFSSHLSWLNALFGLLISICITLMAMPKRIIFRINLFHLSLLVIDVIWELICSSLEVSWDIIRPVSQHKTDFIHLPLKCAHQVQVSVLTSLVSLTPGTVSIDVDKNDHELIIHVMFSQNEAQIIHYIQHRLEPRVMRTFQYD